MIRRLFQWLLHMLIGLDQLAQCWLRGWAYVWFNVGGLPSADQTISAYVGLQADAGKMWALIAQTIIDFLMRNPNHCQQAITDDGKD